MPGAASPFLDPWAPPQYVYGSAGGAGPVRSPSDLATAAVDIAAAPLMNDSSSSYDPNLTYKLAGTIVLALVVIFVLQGTGFRFVGAAQVGIGR